jgi:hypothetical protein
MKYTIEMALDGRIYIPRLIKIDCLEVMYQHYLNVMIKEIFRGRRGEMACLVLNRHIV